MITDNIIISLNSRYGTKNNDTYLSNVYFPFQGILTDDPLIKQKYITLLNAQIPVSFYIINEYNNLLLIAKNGSPYEIQLENGNYSSSSLMTALKEKIESVISGLTVTITLSKTTGKLNFLFSDTVTFAGYFTTMRQVLGFTENFDFEGGINTALQYPLNLLGTKKLFIKSSILNVSSYDSINTNKTSILATIPVDQPFYNMISYTSSIDTNQHELKLNILDGIDIQIYDEDNNLVNFNNIDWTITLNLSIEKEEVVNYSYDLTGAIETTQEQAEIKTFEEAQQEDAQEQQAEEPIQPLNEIKLSHSINQPVTLSGQLKQYSEALLTGSNNYTTNVIDIIKENGDNLIVKMTLKRRPISEIFEKALNYSTFGAFDKANPYDKLFHLAVVLQLDNGRSYTLEKNATILLADPINKPNTEYKDVTYPTENIVSLNTLLERTRQRMGRKYFLYNAKSNNCQDFLLNVFDANNIGGAEEREFIKQDTRRIFNESPSYLKAMTEYVTNAGGRYDNTKSFLFNLYKHKTDLDFLLK
jgi:hypothetical protein